MGKRGHGIKRKSSYGVTLVAQGSGIIKRTQKSPFDPDDIEYAVREIKAERLSGVTPQFLIGWEGLSDKADTWEPIEHLLGHEDDICAFRAKRKENATAEEGEATARKKQRLSDSERNSAESDGFEESTGGKRRSSCWKYYKVQKDENGKVTHVKC
ncbi:hypothetical protein CYMTET_20275 [Cymbomonas tetramitiformis]|uniref:Chromo domain-containing protein n=1 Tax=Cymbomonas tetramitiformis TaxID=36881 RepID=A0AAE0L4D8_9CHLO|nr:hypothetical protein CYMTET_20275 [Cymbomonas tetramitiformis]